MTILLLQLRGPMQSWGTQDRFTIRGTDTMPSLSGVVGMIMAALGRPESEPIGSLADLVMGARADRPGEPMVDYQTVRGGKDGTFSPADVVQSNRHYLADAAFLVGLEGPDQELDQVARGLSRPRESLFLGRRCCVPSAPILIGIRDGDLEVTLREQAPLVSELPPRLTLELPATTETATAMRMDRPLSFVTDRRSYAPRYVRRLSIPAPQAA
jgi:CRISPR system Cascade subunit CasD